MTPIDITPSLSQCEIARLTLITIHHSLYDKQYASAMDEATKLIKTGVVLRDQILRMTRVSGERG